MEQTETSHKISVRQRKSNYLFSNLFWNFWLCKTHRDAWLYKPKRLTSTLFYTHSFNTYMEFTLSQGMISCLSFINLVSRLHKNWLWCSLSIRLYVFKKKKKKKVKGTVLVQELATKVHHFHQSDLHICTVAMEENDRLRLCALVFSMWHLAKTTIFLWNTKHSVMK